MRAFAPGRVNLIGDHTDYTGGLVLPMAIDLGTTVDGEPGGEEVRLTSDAFGGEAVVALDIADPASVEPVWGALVAGVVAVCRPVTGFTGRIRTTLPIGAGLASSAALEVAVALALGVTGSPLDVARACQEAERLASGVPCGLMDQLASTAGMAGHAVLIDCHDTTVTPFVIPEDVDIVVVHSGEARSLALSAYAERGATCETAQSLIGPLRSATLADVARLPDEVMRARARHVVTENARVRMFATALAARDLAECGRLMLDSHTSLATDFAVSTPQLDALVAELCARPRVHGARMTGAGFGGCVVAISEPGALDAGWHFTPSGSARLLDDA